MRLLIDVRQANTTKLASLIHHPVTALIMVNVVLALVSLFKDIFLAAYLGTSAEADAFIISFFIVDTLGNNLFAAALLVGLIPVFAAATLKKNPKYFNTIIEKVVKYTMGYAGVSAIILFFCRNRLFEFLGGEMTAAMQDVCSVIFTILLPAVIIFPLISIGAAVLQVNNRFVTFAFGPVHFNLIFLLGTVFLYYFDKGPGKAIIGLGVIILIAVLVQCLYTWFFVFYTGGASNEDKDNIDEVIVKTINSKADRKIHIDISKNPDEKVYNDKEKESVEERVKEKVKETETGTGKDINKEIKEIISIFFPYLMVLASTHMVYGVERYLALGLESGTVAALNYCFRLVQFPVWVFVAAVSTVAFPAFSRKMLTEGEDALAKTVLHFLYLGALFTVPLSIVLFLLRTPIIQVLFERGAFTHYSTQITSTLMAGYVLTIVWQGFSALLVRVCFIRGDKYIPLLAAFSSMLVTVLLDFSLVPHFGAAVIGYAAALGTLVNFIVLFLYLRKNLNLHIMGRPREIILFLCSNAVFIITIMGLKSFWPQIEQGPELIRWGYLSLIGLVSLIGLGFNYYLSNSSETMSK